MANDIASAAVPITPAENEGKSDAKEAPKAEPKSVPGLFYAIKGLAAGITRKITGK